MSLLLSGMNVPLLYIYLDPLLYNYDKLFLLFAHLGKQPEAGGGKFQK